MELIYVITHETFDGVELRTRICDAYKSEALANHNAKVLTAKLKDENGYDPEYGYVSQKYIVEKVRLF